MRFLSAIFLWCLPVAAQAVCATDRVSLRGDWGQAQFTVEIADTDAARATGLMHRRVLAASSGMLFVYDRPQALSFWMRNTLIPLDILFIDAAGVVQHIHHRAKPLDETPIFGGRDLIAALEINGGLAARMGITEGSAVRNPVFAADLAAWPCD